MCEGLCRPGTYFTFKYFYGPRVGKLFSSFSTSLGFLNISLRIYILVYFYLELHHTPEWYDPALYRLRGDCTTQKTVALIEFASRSFPTKVHQEKKPQSKKTRRCPIGYQIPYSLQHSTVYGGYTLRSVIDAPLITREVLHETYFLLVIMAADAQARPFLQFQASCWCGTL
jgi:hypothetical protein